MNNVVKNAIGKGIEALSAAFEYINKFSGGLETVEGRLRDVYILPALKALGESAKDDYADSELVSRCNVIADQFECTHPDIVITTLRQAASMLVAKDKFINDMLPLVRDDAKAELLEQLKGTGQTATQGAVKAADGAWGNNRIGPDRDDNGQSPHDD